jgi:hypothetical protein
MKKQYKYLTSELTADEKLIRDIISSKKSDTEKVKEIMKARNIRNFIINWIPVILVSIFIIYIFIKNEI